MSLRLTFNRLRLAKGNREILITLQRFSIECRETKTKVVTGKLQQTQTWTSQKSKQIHLAGAKHECVTIGFSLAKANPNPP